MAINIYDNNQWKSTKTLYVNDNGTWKEPKSTWVYDTTGWRQIYGPLTRQDDFLHITASNGTVGSSVIYTATTNSSGETFIGGTFGQIAGLNKNFISKLSIYETPDDTFYTNLINVTGAGIAGTLVNIIRTQSSGKIIVGGSFTSINGSPRTNLLRLNADGTEDNQFYTNAISGSTSFSGLIDACMIDSNDTILLGGTFTANGNIKNSLTRLQSDGLPDITFNNNLGTGLNSGGNVNVITIDTSGKYVIGGNFTSLNGSTRNRLIKLNSDGTEVTSFYTNLINVTGSGFTGSNLAVVSIEHQPDKKIIAGGGFNMLNNLSRNKIVRLYPDGTEDTAFYTNVINTTGAGFNSDIRVVKLQPDGKILVGGTFTTLNGLSRNKLVRLNSDGTEDTSFYTNLGTGFDNVVYNIILKPDHITVYGQFTIVNSKQYYYQAKLNYDGTVYTQTGFDVRPLPRFIQSDGKILIGGLLRRFNGNLRTNIVRLNSDGTEDTSFYTNLINITGVGFDSLGDIYGGIHCQSTGKIIVGGRFTSLNGLTRLRIIRLNSDGTEDTPFYTNATSGASTMNNLVYSLDINTNDDIFLGGIWGLNGNVKRYFYSLTSTGTFNTSFNNNLGTGFSGGIGVYSVKIQTDGKILVGGAFSSLNGNARNGLVRLNTNGTEDTSFYTNLGTGFPITSGNSLDSPNCIEVQTDGKILAGGSFITLNGNTRNRLVRLNSDGTEDTSFYTNLGTGFNGVVGCILIQPSGKIIVGGAFTTLNGNPRNKLVRLNSDGTEDTSFYTNLGTGFNQTVWSLVQQSDGSIIAGGGFNYVNGIYKMKLCKLSKDGAKE